VKEQGANPDVVRETIKHAGEKVGSVLEQARDALSTEQSATPHGTSKINPKIGD
jgi:hypothetical protein